MLLLIKLAWRNMFRNARRTALASLAIGVGLAGLIFTDALMIGMVESMIRTATDSFLGHGQVQGVDSHTGSVGPTQPSNLQRYAQSRPPLLANTRFDV